MRLWTVQEFFKRYCMTCTQLSISVKGYFSNILILKDPPLFQGYWFEKKMFIGLFFQYKYRESEDLRHKVGRRHDTTQSEDSPDDSDSEVDRKSVCRRNISFLSHLVTFTSK